MNIRNISDKFERYLVKYAPEILAGGGIACWLMTTVFAVKQTPKALENIEEKKKELNTDELPFIEKAKVTAKSYALPIATGVTGTGLICGSVAVNNHQKASIMAAYKIASDALAIEKIYRNNVVETIGEKKEAKIREKVAEQQLKDNPKTQVIVTGKGKSLCYETISGRYFEFDIGKILSVQVDIDKNLRNDNFVSLNELYLRFGLDPLDMGYELGWEADLNSPFEFELDSKLTEDNTPCLVIGYSRQPTTKYCIFYK